VLDAFVSRLRLKRLFVAEGGKNRALNEALSIIGGALVIFTDDDALPDPHCFQAYLAAAQRWPTEAIFGARIEPRFPDNTPAWIRDPEFRFATTAFARYAPAAAEERVSRHPYGPSFAVRRYALANHRFATHLGPQSGAYAMGGEGHFLRALQRDGWAYVYVPCARVEHVIRQDQITPQWLLQRANKKGRGQVYAIWRPARFSNRKSIPGSVFAISCAAARSRSYSLNDAQVPRNPHASRKASNN
jgi:GT2 family glycosyltransferase